MADEEGPPVDKDRETARLNKDLDKVTDYVEEREIDEEKFRNTVTGILDDSSGKDSAKVQREKELAAVTIKEEDVESLITEMDLDKQAAERCLREHGGDLVEAFRSLVE